MTVPYEAGFDRFTKNVNGFYFGASLAALERLAQRKGYRLVGAESSGNNAFFIDADIPAPNLATVTSAQCWHPMEYLTSRGWTMEQCFSEIKALPLVSVCAAPLPLTLAIHAAALSLAERYQLAFYDALIVASALDAGCTTLLSEDLHHGLVVADRLTVHNPFRSL